MNRNGKNITLRDRKNISNLVMVTVNHGNLVTVTDKNLRKNFQKFLTHKLVLEYLGHDLKRSYKRNFRNSCI